MPIAPGVYELMADVPNPCEDAPFHMPGWDQDPVQRAGARFLVTTVDGVRPLLMREDDQSHAIQPAHPLWDALRPSLRRVTAPERALLLAAANVGTEDVLDVMIERGVVTEVQVRVAVELLLARRRQPR